MQGTKIKTKIQNKYFLVYLGSYDRHFMFIQANVH
jgi:hypothetical protein